MASRLCLVVFAFLLLASAESANKRWKGPTNLFHSPSNWESGHIPCSADNVTFKSTWTPSAVYIQNSIVVKSLTFNEDGVLLLGNSVSIGLKSGDTSCSGRAGEAAVYQGQDPGDWDDPNNWETLDSLTNPASTASLATTARLPCESDSISFPAKSAVSVRLNHPVKVSAMVVDNTALTPASLSQFLLSDNGRGQFKLPSAKAIAITGQSCTQGACACGNTGSQTSKGYSAWRSACSFVGSCSATGNCRQPVMLSGDCCAYCGALVNATVERTFRRNQFEASVKKYVGTQSYKIAVSSGSQVQVLLTGSKAVTLVDELAADMRKVPASYTLPTTPTLAVQKSIAQENPVQVVTVLPYETDEGGQVVTDAAGKPVPSECQPSGNSEKNTGGNSGSSSDNTPWFVVAAISVVLLIVIIILIVYYITRKRVEKNAEKLQSVRFHRTDSYKGGTLTSMILDDGETYETIPALNNTAIENPLYSKGLEEERVESNLS